MKKIAATILVAGIVFACTNWECLKSLHSMRNGDRAIVYIEETGYVYLFKFKYFSLKRENIPFIIAPNDCFFGRWEKDMEIKYGEGN